MQSLWESIETAHDRAPSDTLRPQSHSEVVVVGAGLTGLATALLLSRAGVSVTVIEARHIGAATTGKSTAKLSLLHSGVLADIHHHASTDVLRAYVEGNREGQQWLLRYLEHHGLDVERRHAYSYATTDEGIDAVKREFAACKDAGLSAELVGSTGLPFAVSAAVKLEDQAQINPLLVLRKLAADLRERGGHIVEGVRVTGVSTREPCVLETDQGSVTADAVVLATGIPILDRGLYFAKVQPTRSYVTTFRMPDGGSALPHNMYLSLDAERRSLRTAHVNGEDMLLVGGNGHVVGREPSPQAQIDGLVEWTTTNFPGAEPVHRWSAQDYMSLNRVPFVGSLPRSGGRVKIATGFNKWGMTNAVAAALRITGELLDGNMEWANTLGHRVTQPPGFASVISINAEVAAHLVTDWAQAELHALPEDPPAEGAGVVGREDGRPVAVSRVNGAVCKVSAVCPHLGGILSWNDAEKSWDCPLHGSRFDADGTLLEGPAVENLAARE